VDASQAINRMENHLGGALTESSPQFPLLDRPHQTADAAIAPSLGGHGEPPLVEVMLPRGATSRTLARFVSEFKARRGSSGLRKRELFSPPRTAVALSLGPRLR
jgi:hypothetical protein